MPTLKVMRQVIGYSSVKNFQVNVTPSIAEKMNSRMSVSQKVISDETFCDSKKRYFGTLTFVNMLALVTSAFMQRFVESVKYANTS